MFPAAPLMLAKRNERAISNYCKDGKLQAKMMLIFRHMPNCQHESCEALCEHEIARVDWETSTPMRTWFGAASSACAGDNRRKGPLRRDAGSARYTSRTSRAPLLCPLCTA